tara:strand:+ start:12005 stop:13210 length:1206 start_codon:yes stop_codon:yes gene_type:complete
MKGWTTSKLSSLGFIQTGSTPKTAVKENFGSFISFIKPADFLPSGEIVSKSDEGLSEKGLVQSRLMAKGSVLMVCIGATIGKVGYTKVDVAANQQINSFTPSDKIITKFAYYAMTNDRFQRSVIKSSGQATLPIINKSKWSNLEISYPVNVAEQKRIVAILDQAFDDIEQARAKTKQNLKNARELFESYLQQVFSQRGDGWVERKLSDVCEITSKLVDPREEEYLDLPHIGAGNMISNTGKLIDIQTAREEGLISGKFVFDESMVLYSKIRPYLMKICRPDFIGLCSADVYPLCPIGEKIDKNYLFYLLLSKDFTDYAIAGSGRAGMPKVNRTHLFNYNISIPCIEKQREYAEKIDHIAEQTQALESIYEKKLAQLDELKKSILQKAFSGELTKEQEGAAA